MKILLADDHRLVRAGIRRLLEDLPEVSAVLEADDGEEAVEAATRDAPDIVITDIGMPRMTGLELAAWLKHNLPQVRVIILSMHAAEEYVAEALAAGARGYLLKRSASEEMELALRAVSAGEIYLSPAIARRGASSERPRITPRQREVLKLVAQGRTTREIASQLGLSPRTIDTHRAEPVHELGVRDAIGLLREAARLGLIDLGSP
ncbi:MAG TPA: response regulator transcription factor [Burkholderiales bacterium]|nr:response regulator transcription factor [Burkholderiales bacterium]